MLFLFCFKDKPSERRRSVHWQRVYQHVPIGAILHVHRQEHVQCNRVVLECQRGRVRQVSSSQRASHQRLSSRLYELFFLLFNGARLFCYY